MSYQGKLDGLCGMYAVANALAICTGRNDLTQLEGTWDAACRVISSRRLHDVLINGTDMADMKHMLKAAIGTLSTREQPEVTYPFEGLTRITEKAFKTRLMSFFDEGACCAIVFRNKPSRHWLVAEREGSRMRLTDSAVPRDRSKPYRKNLAAISTGRRVGLTSPTKWVIDRRDLAVLWKVRD